MGRPGNPSNSLAVDALTRETGAARPRPAEPPRPPAPRPARPAPGEILVEEPDPEAAAPGLLYARHADYARRLAQALAARWRLDPFTGEEAEDAALEGLLDAAQLWQDRSHTARFTTYAYWHIRGSILGRLAEVRRRVSLDAGPGSPRGRGWATGAPLPAPGEVPFPGDPEEQAARRVWPHVEAELNLLRSRQRVASLVVELREAGRLSPVEERIVGPLFLEQQELPEVAAATGLDPPRIRAAALRLLQRLRTALRDDSLLPEGCCRLPLEELPTGRAEGLQIARETLQLLRAERRAGGAPPVTRPLASFLRLLPDIEAVARRTGVSAQLGAGDTPCARVASFYRRILGLGRAELAGELEMKGPALDKLLRQLNLDARQSTRRILRMANALAIDPEQLLFRASPRLGEAFDRVLYAGEDVYLALLTVPLPPAELLPILRAGADPGGGPDMGSLIAGYRLARGIPSAASLGRYYKGFEAGEATAIEGCLAMARQIGMPPLLALLGTRPELLALFDLLDGEGTLLHASERDYGRIYLVLEYQKMPGSRDLPPAEAPTQPDLAAYLRYLLGRCELLLTPERLAAAGINPLLLAHGLAGRAPHQPEALRPLAELLALDPIAEARLCCEALYPRTGPEEQATIRELCRLAHAQTTLCQHLATHGWEDLSLLLTADPDATRQLTHEFYGRSRRGHRGYLRELLLLWRGAAAEWG